MAEIKVTKQDLQEAREPDAVLVASRSAFDWLVERRGVAIGTLVAVLALLGIGSAVQSRSASKDREAGAKLSLAVGDLARPVGAEARGEEDDADAEPRKFATKEERGAAVRTQLDEVIAQRGGSAAARVAELALAQQALEAGKADEALAGLQKFVDGGKAFGLEAFAHEAMGYAYEAKGDWAQAQAAFDKMGVPSRAAYHKARLLQAQGKKEEAREAYKAIVAQYPSDTVTQEARVRLDLLDVPEAGKGALEAPAKAEAKPAPKSDAKPAAKPAPVAP